MKAILCNSCNGYYYNDDETNEMIVLQLDIKNSMSAISDLEISMMNPNLKSNYLKMIYSSKGYLEQKLGNNAFCTCVYKKIKDRNLSSIKHTKDKLSFISEEKINEAERRGELMMLMSGIENIIEKFRK